MSTMSSTLTSIKSKQALDLPKYALDRVSIVFHIYFEIDVEFCDAHFVVITNM